MAIRRELDKDETMSVGVGSYRELFLGKVHGVLLCQRDHNDKHVCFKIIHEDDGYWYLSTTGASIHWVDDFINVLDKAKKWCERYCEADIQSGKQYGWKFKI